MRDTVTLTRAEYEALVDARDAAVAMRAVASGAMETLSGTELDAYLAAPTPLAFWRRHRSLTQAALAQAVGVSQPYLAQMERGQRGGDVRVLAKLAKTLGVRIEDLLEDEEGSVTAGASGA